jgi:hypothetical protein
MCFSFTVNVNVNVTINVNNMGTTQNDWRDTNISVSTKLKTKLSGLSPRANYIDRETAACQRS